MELKEALKLIIQNKKYIFLSVIICLIIGYLFILNENRYEVASFSIYLKLNKDDQSSSENFDQIKNTFFVLKTSESFIDSIRFWLFNDMKQENLKIFSRKITPQHLFVQIKQIPNFQSLSSIKDEIVKFIEERKNLLFNPKLNIFSIEISDYKEYKSVFNVLTVIILSLLTGLFVGFFLILFLRYVGIVSFQDKNTKLKKRLIHNILL